MKQKIVPSVNGCVFSEDRKEILLIERRDVPVWVLPGGGVEKNELPEEAIIREIEEETGFSVKVKRQVGEYYPINKLARLTYLYECTLLGGSAKTSSETKNVRFFKIDKLPKLMPPPYAEWINDAHQNLPQLIRKNLTSVNYITLIKNLFFHPLLVLRFLLTKIGLTINT